MIVVHDVVEGVDVTERSSRIVVFVADWFDAARIANREQEMPVVVGVSTDAAGRVVEAREIAVRVVVVGQRVPGGVHDLRNATTGVASERHARSTRMEQSFGANLE